MGVLVEVIVNAGLTCHARFEDPIYVDRCMLNVTRATSKLSLERCT